MEWNGRWNGRGILVWNMEDFRYGKEWKILRMEWNAIFHTFHTWISLTE